MLRASAGVVVGDVCFLKTSESFAVIFIKETACAGSTQHHNTHATHSTAVNTPGRTSGLRPSFLNKTCYSTTQHTTSA